MTVILVQRTGARSMLDVMRPELVIRIQGVKCSMDFDLHSIDTQCRLVYVERMALERVK